MRWKQEKWGQDGLFSRGKQRKKKYTVQVEKTQHEARAANLGVSRIGQSEKDKQERNKEGRELINQLVSFWVSKRFWGEESGAKGQDKREFQEVQDHVF